jgi:hypothetical protein
MAVQSAVSSGLTSSEDLAKVQVDADPNRSRSSSPKGSMLDAPEVIDFKPTVRFWLAFLTIAVLTLMVALDGTSISVALPVCFTMRYTLVRKTVLTRPVRSSLASCMVRPSRPSGVELPSFYARQVGELPSFLDSCRFSRRSMLKPLQFFSRVLLRFPIFLAASRC